MLKFAALTVIVCAVSADFNWVVHNNQSTPNNNDNVKYQQHSVQDKYQPHELNPFFWKKATWDALKALLWNKWLNKKLAVYHHKPQEHHQKKPQQYHQQQQEMHNKHQHEQRGNNVWKQSLEEAKNINDYHHHQQHHQEDKQEKPNYWRWIEYQPHYSKEHQREKVYRRQEKKEKHQEDEHHQRQDKENKHEQEHKYQEEGKHQHEDEHQHKENTQHHHEHRYEDDS